MTPQQIAGILTSISGFVGSSPDDLAVTIAARTRGPYGALVATILANRCRDETTQVVVPRLLDRASTPQEMLGFSDGEIAKIIYRSSLDRTKAVAIRKASKQIFEEHGGLVPNTLEGLLTLYGIGRKSANLILTLGFGKPGICVDTHVHRISNRLGFVRTKKPEKTERALLKILPKKWWIDINGVLIAFGRKHCTPTFPKCSTCPIRKKCKRIGVKKSR